MARLSENSLVVTHNKSYSLTAEIEVPTSGASGVIVALGGSVGGWSLYAQNGRLKHCYNFFGIERYYAEGTQPIPAGKHQVRMEFKYDGGGLAKGGTVSLFVDGKKDGEGRVDQTVPMLFSADETCDVGKETGSTVSPDYGPGDNRFSGQVNWVQIDLEKDDHDHLISAEERFHGRDGATVAERRPSSCAGSFSDGRRAPRGRCGRRTLRRCPGRRAAALRAPVSPPSSSTRLLRPLQERPIVRHEHHRPLEVVQRLEQHFLGREIEVVGRLVEDEEVGRIEEHARHHQARLLAA